MRLLPAILPFELVDLERRKQLHVFNKVDAGTICENIMVVVQEGHQPQVDIVKWNDMRVSGDTMLLLGSCALGSISGKSLDSRGVSAGLLVPGEILLVSTLSTQQNINRAEGLIYGFHVKG